MKKFIFTTLLILIFLVGCATYPPARIENGRYLNPRYRYSIEIPEGWTPIEEIPDVMRRIIPYKQRKGINIILFNKENGGAILIATEKFEFSISHSELYLFQKEFQKEFEKRIEKEIKGPDKTAEIKNSYYYGVDKDYSCDFCEILHFSFIIESEFAKNKMEGRIYINISNEPNNLIFFGLVANLRAFNESYSIFNKVTNSLRKFSEPQKTQQTVSSISAEKEDVNIKKGSLTPLHVAAYHGNKEEAELLVAKGADVNVKDKDDVTPLHVATNHGHKELAELLISEGADVNAKDKNGRTPLYWATEFNYKKVAGLLRRHGGKYN
jgi:hypothetical protein